MPWTPTRTVIYARAIPENLLTYFETNQADALTWAGGGSLKPIRRFGNSVANRAVPVYPSIAFYDDNDAVDYTTDLALAGYSCTFELMIAKAKADDADAANTVVTDARKYARAYLSMILNCPNATLAANTGTHANAATVETIECGFDPIRTNDKQNEFLQAVQIRATFRLQAAGI